MRIHDRYLLADFWRNIAIALTAFTIIYVTVDINEQISSYIDNHARVADIALYYLFKIPWILVLVMPVAILLATVFTLGKLSRQNELTAFISSGTSLVRVAAPIMLSALLVSFAVMLLGEFAIPQATERSERIKRVNIEKQKEEEGSRWRENIHYQGEEGRTFYAERYDRVLKSFTNVIVQEYTGSTIRRRIDAKRAFWDGSEWVFLDGAVRDFAGGGERITTFTKLPMKELSERPEDFEKENIDPEEMNFRQLRTYIDKMVRGGSPVDKYLVDLYFKVSFPFTNLIFAVIGTALASAKRKPSMATGFGLTLMISFTYYGVLKIGQALGHSGVIEPLLGAWMGNMIFIVVGGVLLYRANR
jgi:lipopolysaccharide export system permease protein